MCSSFSMQRDHYLAHYYIKIHKRETCTQIANFDALFPKQEYVFSSTNPASACTSSVDMLLSL